MNYYIRGKKRSRESRIVKKRKIIKEMINEILEAEEEEKKMNFVSIFFFFLFLLFFLSLIFLHRPIHILSVFINNEKMMEEEMVVGNV